MNTHASDWPELLAMFERIVDAPPGERVRLLDQATRDRSELRSRLEHLLALDASDSDFVADVAGWRDQFADTSANEAIPARVGAWNIVRELGAGGMGRVFLAERADGEYEQKVALKVIRGEFTTDAAIARFLAERRILARLDHPGIASLVDGGVDEHGRPWFAMQYVDGVALPDYCTQHGLGLEARLKLMIGVCEAVAYAHRQLVVHCDLKPSNVLVDTNGQPRLLDFGIARLMGADNAPHLTQTGALTPGYAAPEQLAGKPVSVATDVYALGVMLHELLVGARPYEDGTSSAVTIAVAQSRGEPPAPSRVAREDKPVPARRLRGELDAIVTTALRHELSRRYADAAALGEELGRFLAGLPVRAHGDSRIYRSAKFVRRHRAGIAAVGAVFVALCAAFAISLVQTRRTQAALEQATAVQHFLLGVFDAAQPMAGANSVLTVRELADHAVANLDTALADDSRGRIDVLLAVGTVYQRLGFAGRSRTMLTRVLDSLDRRHAARSDPRRIEALLTLGRDDYDLSDYAHAIDHLGEADSLAKAVHAPSARRATILYELGSSYSAAGRFDPALAALDEAEQAATNHDANPKLIPHIRIERALVWERSRKLDRAIAEGLRAVAAARERYGDDAADTANMASTVGSFLREGGKLDQAEAQLRQALAIDLRAYGQLQPAVVNNLANVLQDRGRYNEAEPMFEKALQLAGGRDGLDSVSTANYRRDLAMAQMEAGHLDRAKVNLHQAYAQFSHGNATASTTLYVRAALAHIERLEHHPDMAAKLLAGILASAPAHGAEDVVQDVHMDRARLALEAHDPHTALTELRAAEAALDPADLENRDRVRLDLLRGDVERANGDTRAANADYQRALDLARTKLDPQHPLALAAAERLKSPR